MEMSESRTPWRWALYALVGASFGSFLGVGLYTFVYAKGYSYLSSDPKACVNCHIMQPQFDAWVKSTHHAVAACNDCHMPHDFAGKWSTKAWNGFWHSYYFTTGLFPDPIRITKRNHNIAEAACRNCHADIVSAMDGIHRPDDKLSCIQCHGSVGHSGA